MPDVTPSFGERTIGCRRMHGCAHSSKTSRSAKTPITYQELTKALHISPPGTVKLRRSRQNTGAGGLLSCRGGRAAPLRRRLRSEDPKRRRRQDGAGG
jgi:hypothetical protein